MPVLILGDSHPQYDLDPIIVGNAYNFSSSGENYIQTFYKLNKILEKKNVGTIILPIDLQSFSSYRSNIPADFYWTKYVDYIEVGRKKGDFFQYFVKYLQAKYIPYLGDGEEIVRQTYQLIFDKLERSDLMYGYIPQYSNFDEFKNKEELGTKQASFHFYKNNYFDDDLVFYFKKIIDLAAEKNINVILIKFPITKQYYLAAQEFIPIDSYYLNLGKILEGIRNIQIIDYQKIYFDNDNYFEDTDHLNYKGAVLFSQLLRKDLLNLDKNSNLQVKYE